MNHDERLGLYERSYSPSTAPSYSPYYSMQEDSRCYPDGSHSQTLSVPGGYVNSGIAHSGSAASYLYGPSEVPESSMSSMRRPSHHHHRLPDMGHSSTSMYGEGGQDPQNLVGTEGMPFPARRPQRPRIKFTLEEDELLIELKEKKNLTWKQIADFFPGRNPGTLQVRYCTRLKTEGISWTREMVCDLLQSLLELSLIPCRFKVDRLTDAGRKTLGRLEEL